MIASTIHKRQEKQKISLVWVPSHVGISGNESADKAAKEALAMAPANLSTPVTDLFPTIEEYTTRHLWQEKWAETPNDMHEVQPEIRRPPKVTYKLSPNEERIMCRLRIGHTRLTHRHRLERTPQPRCEFCQTALTVKHILLQCAQHAEARETMFGKEKPNSIKEIFELVPATRILWFVKAIKIINEI